MPDEGSCEWLEADGDGGFASGTSDGIRTRRYHALLLTAAAPPGGRLVMVNAVDAWLSLDGAWLPLFRHRYAPGLVHPEGGAARTTFADTPWPAWDYELPGGGRLRFDLFVVPGSGQVSMRWRLSGRVGPAVLHVRPLLSGRDYHALHHENPAFGFEPVHRDAASVVWQPYGGLPPVACHGGTYTHDPVWYRGFLYAEEAARGLDSVEDLAAPGLLSWDLAAGPATLALRADRRPALDVDTLAAREAPRRASEPPLQLSALRHVAVRGPGLTVIAGFPWFTDWGRDTFIALRGVLIATHRIDAARQVLLAWSDLVSEGMLPNRFPDGDAPPEYNAVDASLWFIVAVADLFAAGDCPEAEAARLRAACTAILEGYAAGTRYGIRADADGLIMAGVPGIQLTWMDAKVGDWVVTPRIGKPVEVQALWINALALAGAWPGGERWGALEALARASFLERFPDAETGGLVDVVDCDGVPGTVDRRVRPNQVLAAGGLPLSCVPAALAGTIMRVVEARLLTPLGLRTLDPADPDYRGRYEGGVLERDGAYHQGTAWPWLLDPFVEGWLQVRDHAAAAKAEARARFLVPLRAHLDVAGLGSVSEIVDGDAPHTPRGCPFQAWSVGSMLRIESMLKETT